MFTVTTFESPPLVKAELVGRLTSDEIQHLSRDLDRRLLFPEGPTPTLLIDVRRYKPAGEHLIELLDLFIARSLDAGIRIGRVVESEIIAHQLDRVAKEADLQDRIRHFWELDPALAWLREPAG